MNYPKENNVPNLNYKDLLKLQEVIKFIISNIEKPILLNLIKNISRKRVTKQGEFVLDTLCFMLTPGQNNLSYNNKYKISEYIARVIYLPISNRLSIHEYDANILFTKYLNKHIDTIVNCTHDHLTNNLSVIKVLDKTLITANYYNLDDLFDYNPSIFTNRTLFLFEEITWEGLCLIFKRNCIIIRGDSHSKRHVLSPLDIRLLDTVVNLNRYVEEGMNQYRDFNYEKNREFYDTEKDNYRVLLKKLIDYSYHRSDNSRALKNEKYVFLYTNFIQYMNLAFKAKGYSDPLYEVLFLQLFQLIKEGIILYLTLLDTHKDIFNKQLIEIEQRINEVSPRPSIKNKNLNTSNNIKDISSKRGIHTIRRVSTSANSLVNLNPVKAKYFIGIKDILNNNNFNNKYEAQQMIETSWQSLFKDFISEDENVVNKYTRDPGIIKKGIRFVEELFIKKSSNLIKRCGLIIKDHDFNCTNALFIAYVVGRDCAIKDLGYTHSAMQVGHNIISEIFIKKRQEYRNSCVQQNRVVNYPLFLINLDEFIYNFELTDERILYIGDFFLSRLIEEPIAVFERSFNRILGYLRNEAAVLKFNPEKLDEIRNLPLLHPVSLPMLCPPNKWSDSEFGGYLINKDLQEDIIIGGKDHKHSSSNRTLLYTAVNIMANIKFSVNKKLLNYLMTEGSYLLDSLSIDALQRSITLYVADLYKDNIFYIPVRADWRGRLYSSSTFLNYQSNDLSSSLIQFAEGEVLNTQGFLYLYIYGANLYNFNGCNKSNYSSRIKWIEDNKINILSMNPDFIKGAEEKIKFAAFCLLMRELEINPNYLVKLPVFFDATCSGIQHLSGLMRDVFLAREVNLTRQTKEDNVYDIYSKLAFPINEKIRWTGRENPAYMNLREVDLSRDIVKRPIMTKTYNVSIEGIINQLKENFSKIKEDNLTRYKAPSIIKGKYCYLSTEDVRKIATIINDTFFEEYPLIELFYDYMKDLAKIMNLANLGICWLTPQGLKLVQYYNAYCNKSILIPLNKKKANIRIKSGKLDKNKQVNAIIPNVIHSLDANHLMKVVVNSYDKICKPLITIHDCFGIHPNHMANLCEIVKFEFVELYSNQNFIQEFHIFNLNHLKANGFEIKLDDNTGYYLVKINNSWELIPKPPLLGGLDLQEVKNSIYFLG